jgi:hypothetical protein
MQRYHARQEDFFSGLLAAAGVVAAPHINARCNRDYERYGAFLKAHPEISAIAFEFATGARSPARRNWHVSKLCAIPSIIGRDIHLVIRGGFSAVKRLSSVYQHLIVLDTDPMLKTIKRQRKLVSENSKYRRSFSLVGQDLDELLQHNIDKRRKMFETTFSRGSESARRGARSVA